MREIRKKCFMTIYNDKNQNKKLACHRHDERPKNVLAAGSEENSSSIFLRDLLVRHSDARRTDRDGGSWDGTDRHTYFAR
jgi:hypothetical protein